MCTGLLKSKFFFQLTAHIAIAWDENFAFVMRFDITGPDDQIDHVFNCVCIRWANEDEKGYNIDFDLLSGDNGKIGDWYGLVPLPTVASVFCSVCSNYTVKDLAPHLRRSAHHFYIYEFYQPRRQ